MKLAATARCLSLKGVNWSGRGTQRIEVTTPTAQFFTYTSATAVGMTAQHHRHVDLLVSLPGWSKLILVRAAPISFIGLHFELTPYSHYCQLFKRAGLQ
jgi:hypothetical protein